MVCWAREHTGGFFLDFRVKILEKRRFLAKVPKNALGLTLIGGSQDFGFCLAGPESCALIPASVRFCTTKPLLPQVNTLFQRKQLLHKPRLLPKTSSSRPDLPIWPQHTKNHLGSPNSDCTGQTWLHCSKEAQSFFGNLSIFGVCF